MIDTGAIGERTSAFYSEFAFGNLFFFVFDNLRGFIVPAGLGFGLEWRRSVGNKINVTWCY